MGLQYKKGDLDLTPIWDTPPTRIKKEPKVYIKKEKLPKSNEFLKYKKKVDLITENNKHLIDGIETRGWKNYHIDHKLSISWGYHNDIEPERIAHPDNLRMLWWKDNWDKGTICYVDDKNSWISGDLPIFTEKNSHINIKK